jgi:hypothetical protein
MTRLRLHAPSHATVVAYVALFLALGGTTYAAVALPSNSVGTKQLQSSAVTGAKVKANTLTGKQIKESTLGQVPSAKSASHAASATTATTAATATTAGTAATATNASELGGQPASSYLSAGTVQRLDVDQSDCVAGTDPGCTIDVLTADGFVLTSECGAGNGGAQEINVTTVPSGATAADFGVQHGSPSVAQADSEFTGSGPWELIGSFGMGVSGVPFGGSFILRSPDHTITITGYSVMTDNAAPTSTTCRFFGTAVIG